MIGFVDKIVDQCQLPIEPGSNEYKQFCRQSLEMLYRLDQRKSQYKDQVLYGSQPQTTSITSLSADSANDLPKVTIRDLIDQYTENKVSIEKTWKNPRTVKGYQEYLARIAEMFDYISKTKNPIVPSLTKAHARDIRRILL